MRGSVKRFCVCVGADGRRLRDACPDLRDRRHGTWSYAVRLDTGAVRHRQLKRSGFATRAQATSALEHVRALVALAGDDDHLRRRIGDVVFEKSARGGTLPSVEEVRRRLGADLDVTGTNLTVGEYLAEWLATRRDLKETSRGSARAHMETWLVPNLGDVPLERLRPRHITDMLDLITERNREVALARAQGRDPRPDERDGRRRLRVTGVATQHRIFSTLRTALNDAVRNRLIERNPCDAVRLEVERRAPSLVWSPEQVGAFLDAIEDDRLAPLFHLVLLRGLRRGEACGLRWSDLDLDAGCLEVRQTLLQVGGRVVFSTPKSRAGERVVSLDAGTVAVLRTHRKAQLRERLQAGEAYEDHDLVFARPDGSVTPPWHVSYRFRRLAQEAGLPVIRLHDGRHTAATLALEADVPLKVVSDQLGHANTAITADLYTHVRRAVHDAAAERVANLVPRGTRRRAAEGT